ncbi:MAG: HTH domain-containing protein [Planctomycetota bacterium]
MAKQLTWKQAIERVLTDSAEPMHYQEITEKIIADKLRTNLGATPASTVNAIITGSIKHDGKVSPYAWVSRGTFALKPEVHNKKGPARPALPEIDEETGAIVTSFGMFWRRELVKWLATPKLLGMQQIGSKPVDFFNQLGVYLLYDGREVIYVGRSTDRPLGRRLYEHTVDRMSSRWDRFSWFGLLPVSEAGALGTLPGSFDAKTMIPALEAILIEALEPRQNRKRGDDLAAVEYVQKEDPVVKKQLLKEFLDTL